MTSFLRCVRPGDEQVGGHQVFLYTKKPQQKHQGGPCNELPGLHVIVLERNAAEDIVGEEAEGTRCQRIAHVVPRAPAASSMLKLQDSPGKSPQVVKAW